MDLTTFIKNKTTEEKLGIVFFAISLIYVLIITYVGFTKLGTVNDEIFSLGLVQFPLNELIARGSVDSHPLLYYIIFKGFIKVFSLLNITNIVLIGKFVSLMPLYLLIILSITKIRKNWGLLTAGIFTLCISSMPQLMIYFVQIRMYGWSLFFVTASLVYVYEIIKNPNLKNWGILTLLTICSAQTHYFSGIASFSLYLLFLAYILYSNKSLLKKWVVSTIISILSFLPWSFIALNQIVGVSGGFWIDPISFKTIISYIYFIFSPANIIIISNELLDPTILGSLFLLSICVLIIYYLKEDKKEFKNNFAFMGIGVFLLVPLIGIFLSSLHNPIFHQRYMVPAIGCLWLGISILLSKYYTKKEIFIPIIILILIIGILGTIGFINIQDNIIAHQISYQEVWNLSFPGVNFNDL